MKAKMVALSLATLNWPFGLFLLDAIFAILAFAAMPADMVMWVFSDTSLRS